MNDRLKALSDAGVSIWLDDLSRERLETGNLADLVRDKFVVGVTSNPSIFQAAMLHETVGEPNVMIKIPGTKEGWPAITETTAAGISVNVTLIFGLEQYRNVMEAYVAGLEQAKANGHALADIHSVASFFVSRVDTEIDKRLEATTEGAGTDADLRGKAGVANARLAFQMYEEFFTGERWEALEAAGARKQRPLWASTGVKNPDYDDTMYVVDLAVENTVNTMPEKTLDAVADHGEIRGDRVRPFYDDAHAHMHALAEAGIDYDDVIQTLIKEGVDKFVVAWDELQDTLGTSLEAARA